MQSYCSVCHNPTFAYLEIDNRVVCLDCREFAMNQKEEKERKKKGKE